MFVLFAGEWNIYDDGKTFQLTSGGELKALQSGFGVVFVRHLDERTKLYRETVSYCIVPNPNSMLIDPCREGEK